MTDQRKGVGARVATLGPVGFFPLAPGTLGALLGVAFTAFIERLPVAAEAQKAVLGCLVAGVFGLGVWAAGRGAIALKATDPGPVIIDEFAGQMLALLFHSISGWKGLLAGFLLFRIFDILKPFPAGRAESLPGGWGIMADDVLAGAYSALGLFLLGFAVR